jgi:DNA-binding transcriptional MerR regulator
MSESDIILPVSAAAKILDCSEQSVRNYADQGLLRCFRTATRRPQRLFIKQDVEMFAAHRGRQLPLTQEQDHGLRG